MAITERDLTGRASGSEPAPNAGSGTLGRHVHHCRERAALAELGLLTSAETAALPAELQLTPAGRQDEHLFEGRCPGLDLSHLYLPSEVVIRPRDSRHVRMSRSGAG